MHTYPLIVSNTDDFHADALVAELGKRGVEVFRFNTNLLAQDSEVSWSQSEPLHLVEYGRGLDYKRVTSIIWRRPEAPNTPNLARLDQSVVLALEEETLIAIRGVLTAAFGNDLLWVSHPDSIRSAQYKPKQLRDALRLGFRVPDTLLTNDPLRARDFIERHDYQVAAKQVGRGVQGKQAAADVYTVNLGRYPRERIDSLIGTVRLCPIILQEYVEKQFEVRATFFGLVCMAAKIHSQDHIASRDDWRRFYSHAESGLRHEAMDMPAKVQHKCLAMLREYRLNFGCFDFIVTPGGDFIFLELNPNGQFLWKTFEIEQFPIAEAWADLVTGVSPRLV